VQQQKTPRHLEATGEDILEVAIAV